MNYLKTLGLLMILATALMASAGSAAATSVTSPTGTQYGGTIKAQLKSGTNWVLSSSFIGEVVCEESIIEWKAETQGAGVTAKGAASTLDFSKCNGTVKTLKPGTLEIHGEGSYNGVLTSSGAEITVEIFGLHCIFTTNNTNLGTITGGSPAAIKVASAPIPRTGPPNVFCGSGAPMNAQYNIVTPSTFLID